MDRLSSEQRSRNMAAIRSKNTNPEIIVRKLLFSMGFRYRIHVKSLPGNPDIVLRRLRRVIDVPGCFWHQHDCSEGRRVPKTNEAYWVSKITRNKERDVASEKLLITEGWKILVVWDCEIRDSRKLRLKLESFLFS